jgi:hypothetical protein
MVNDGSFDLRYYSDTLRATTPLVAKIFLTWLGKAYAYYHLTDAEKATSLSKKPQGVGYGIGLALALFAMQGNFGFMLSKLYNVFERSSCIEVASLVWNSPRS